MNVRADNGLAFMLQYENVAWYEKGVVTILDRRIYPNKVEFVKCYTHQDVAKAITDMVTQSAGPYTAAAMGMALAAYECRDQSESKAREYLEKAAQTISNARPTTKARMKIVVDSALRAADRAMRDGAEISETIKNDAIVNLNSRYEKVCTMAQHLVSLFPPNAKVLTQCFGETIVGMMCREAQKAGKALKVYCAETRPYFQGARLTATVASQQGVETTVITDNMAAHAIKDLGINIFTSAADAICLDGHVVNKIGTFQIAIVAKHLGIPYFTTGAPDVSHTTVDTVNIEMRDPEFVLQAMGTRTAAAGVHGYYPSFDITPPSLISAVVTDRGIFSPYNLTEYFGGDTNIEDFVL